ncbi:hypothetical protein GCM10009840_10610 [Pseudolysinimonas kribbensis]|uniref:hypothetical protein n=1 Tax=Pseudolysinimonas kribbensis TaxID=433641 RepID=UPI0031CFD41B
MTRLRPSITALAAVLGGLLLFVALLAGHCPRPILAPHPATAAIAAGTVSPADALAVPANPSCIIQTPAMVAASPTTPAHPPQLVSVDDGAGSTTGAGIAPTSASSRAPPPHGVPSTIDLCVLRV